MDILDSIQGAVESSAKKRMAVSVVAAVGSASATGFIVDSLVNAKKNPNGFAAKHKVGTICTLALSSIATAVATNEMLSLIQVYRAIESIDSTMEYAKNIADDINSSLDEKEDNN